MEATEKLAKTTAISTVFRPRVPVIGKDLFAGRFDQLRELVTTALQPGQHAVVFGERGVGKTSLVNVAYQLLGKQVNRPECGPINCDGVTDFSAMWHKAFREMHLDGSATLGSLLNRNVTPDDIRHVVQNLSKTVFVFDEVDQVKDKRASALMAATIKTLSDHALDTTIVLVGVADSVDALIAEHQSVERALIQIPMPRMSEGELNQIIDKGLAHIGMAIEADARKRIAMLSQGLPHFTHLLALHASQSAIDEDRLRIEMHDVRTAIRRALKQAHQSIVASYDKAISSANKHAQYKQVLLACALASADDRGYFYAGAVRKPLSAIMQKPYDIPAFAPHMSAFCQESRGPVLIKTGMPKNYRFRFREPLMQPYVIMNGLESGLIPDDLAFGS